MSERRTTWSLRHVVWRMLPPQLSQVCCCIRCICPSRTLSSSCHSEYSLIDWTAWWNSWDEERDGLLHQSQAFLLATATNIPGSLNTQAICMEPPEEAVFPEALLEMPVIQKPTGNAHCSWAHPHLSYLHPPLSLRTHLYLLSGRRDYVERWGRWRRFSHAENSILAVQSAKHAVKTLCCTEPVSRQTSHKSVGKLCSRFDGSTRPGSREVLMALNENGSWEVLWKLCKMYSKKGTV